MLKRLTWWIVGATMGSAGSAYFQRRFKRVLKKKVSAITPTTLVTSVRGAVTTAVSEGRKASHSWEQDLRRRFNEPLDS